MGTRRIGIIGAGVGGIAAAVRLREAGYDDVVILEKSSEVGGTWNHNRYPGLQCDVQSHLYSFSFEPFWDWSRPYGNGPEIRAYMNHVVDAYGLRPLVRFDTPVRAAAWDDVRSVWTVTTDTLDDAAFEFDVLVGSPGMFNELNWPDLEGRDDFAGVSFHSARWDWDVDLAGKRVGVIGSAASAVQFVPEVAKVAAHLTLFQRAANWVLPKDDTPYTDEEREYWRTHPDEVLERRRAIFEQADPNLTFSNPAALALHEKNITAALAQVEDPDVRARLRPTVPYGCQRPIFSNHYFPTFNRENVELVTDPIDAVTTAGVRTADGREHVCDVLVYATGFATTKYLSVIDVTGRDGLRLADSWRDGAHAFKGVTTAGFPNLFMLYGPNTNNGSIIYMLEAQVDYTVAHVRWMDEAGLAWVDVRPEVEAAYNAEIDELIAGVGPWREGTCHNYYRGPAGRIVTQWPGPMSEYRRRTEEPDADAYETAPQER